MRLRGGAHYRQTSRSNDNLVLYPEMYWADGGGAGAGTREPEVTLTAVGSWTRASAFSRALEVGQCSFTNVLGREGRGELGSQDGLTKESFLGLEMGEVAEGGRDTSMFRIKTCDILHPGGGSL